MTDITLTAGLPTQGDISLVRRLVGLLDIFLKPGLFPQGDITLSRTPIMQPFVAGGGPTYYGILKRWAGSWVKALLKTYFGGSFVAKPLKRWDGSTWKLVDSGG